MRLGVRGRLLILGLAMVGIILFIADAYLRVELEGLLLERIRADLLVRLELLEREVSAMDASLSDLERWDRVADDYARRSKTRVTLIRSDGAVIGDSSATPPQIAALESHGDRPEVLEALSHGFGSSTRESDELEGRVLYVAAPFRREDVIQGVARIAIPVTETDRAVEQVGQILIFGWVLTLGAAILLFGVGAQLGSRRLERLHRAAQAMTDGDLSVRTGIDGTDEIAELGRSLDRLAEGLSSSLGKLRADRELMVAVLGSMAEGVLVSDRDGTIVLANPALRAFFALDPAVVGMTLGEAFASENGLMTWLERSVGPVSMELESDGKSYLVRATGLPGEGLTTVAGGNSIRPTGRSIGTRRSTDLLAVFVDVTELRKLELVRREFVANASHELRTPVTIIKSAAEACRLELRKDVAGAERFIEIIERNTERLRRLVDDLLELTRVQSAELALDIELLSIEPLVTSVVQLFQNRAEQKRIELRSSITEGDLQVTADRRSTEEALGNLIDNALKYCTDGSTVEVRAVWEEGEVLIAVEDTGPGIAGEHLSRVFERFYRVDPGRSTKVSGTGLGLAIVKHLVEAMRGRVGVESTPGSGSRFWFTLPRHRHETVTARG